MKIFSISMIKNEADIIESFVRYHQAIFDGLVILDNGSTDRTYEILEKLKDEGIPIYLLSDPSVDYIQDIKMTNLLDYTFRELDPDLIVPLDADEFLVSIVNECPSPRTLLESVDQNSVYYVRWRTYVPNQLDDDCELFIPKKFLHARDDKFESFNKVFITKGVWLNHKVSLTMGNHDIKIKEDAKEPIPKVQVVNLRIAHFALRSIEQFKSKILVGWLNSLSRYDRKPREGHQWEVFYRKLKKNEELTQQDLIDNALSYSYFGNDAGRISVQRKPIDLSFLNAVEIKYTTLSEVDPFQNLLENSESMANQFSDLKREIVEEQPAKYRKTTPSAKTSIIISSFNQLTFTRLCVECVKSFTENQDYELIVIDHHSTDGTVEWLKEQSLIKIIQTENTSHAFSYNLGIEAAQGEQLLFLDSDVFVTEGWLENLLQCLKSSTEVGAVGPVSNFSNYYQTISTSYRDLDEMKVFASKYNKQEKMYDQRIKLSSFCLLVKRDVLRKIGYFDEKTIHFIDDYSFRMMKAGYKLLVSKNTFVYHGVKSAMDMAFIDTRLKASAEAELEKKWGFNPSYSTYIRQEIIELIDAPRNQDLKVLEVGCACGATLLQIKNDYPNSRIYGIELNHNAVAIASNFTEIKSDNVEKDISFPEQFFDYIIFADVLEHLYDPWLVLKNIRKYLSKEGKLLISVPNVMHFSLLRELFKGNWTYTDAGLLDRTHLRFFTHSELERMLGDAGYKHFEFTSTKLGQTDQDKVWIEKLTSFYEGHDKEQFEAYQYIVKAHNEGSFKAQQKDDILRAIKELEDPEQLSVGLDKMSCLVEESGFEFNEIISFMVKNTVMPLRVCNLVAEDFIERCLYEKALILLKYALTINAGDRETLINMAKFLFLMGEFDISLNYLNQIKQKNSVTNHLIDECKLRLQMN